MPPLARIALSIAVILFAFCCTSHESETRADDTTVALEVDTPMSPPEWALLQRELLRANSAACEEFYGKYFDERGFLLCVERWGGDDGPDDAIENCLYWPILHSLGGDDRVLELYKSAWEGHVRQYTLARTRDVPYARDGMYYKEFPVKMDWFHNSEGLTVFCLEGLSDPNDDALIRRTRRFAGFYLNDDPQAANYDPEHRIIRSMFNGSRGPLLRKANALDWAGDPIEVEGRFDLGHGERSYEEMLAHFKDYTDIVGDHPQNLLSTALPLNAFMLTGEERYRDWILEYVDAWRDRMIANGNIIPTNIGLDGTIGGETEGKWYGGVYGWSFSVEVPQTGELAHRNSHDRGLAGFMAAYLLTGDDRYLEPWRKQVEVVNSQMKMIDGAPHYPHMYGDDGWYQFTREPYSAGLEEIAWLTQKPDDVSKMRGGWWEFIKEQGPSSFPVQALRADLERVRRRIAAMRTDETTPDTRLSDDPNKYNPASVRSLVRLMLGGLPTNKQGLVLYTRLRYFDPVARRAGIPDDCAALVEDMDGESVTVTLVNINQLEARTVTIQAGGYAAHDFKRIGVADESMAISGRSVTVRLRPGAGARLRLEMDRYVNQPTMAFPWDRRD